MFLKSLEIRGFKSFADKTELQFKKGITAVVGPNGSGKSNISDAVRWVLGEQSVKSLRGGKMEDVIFAGTQYRKPVGLAQVSLVLDNSDSELPLEYSDVNISRRLYRSGDSEYYINNTQCRLKDVQELFMDTGIGKEGYSIIGQGKIDAILSGKPEDRRNLLEEAAGIVKYKTRKEESQRKLESCENNLIRIKDILNTYEERLEPLRLESEKAKAFLDISEKLKVKEINILISNIDKIQAKISELQTDENKLASEIDSLFREDENANVKLKLLNDKLEQHEMHVEKEKQKYYEQKTELQNIESNVNLLREKIKNINSFFEKSKLSMEKALLKIDDLNKNKSDTESNLKMTEAEQQALNETIEASEESLKSLFEELTEDEDLIKALKEKQIEYLKNSSGIKNEINILENKKDTLLNKHSQTVSSIEGYNNTLKINDSTRAGLESELDSEKTNIAYMEKQIKKYNQEIAASNSELQKDEKKQREMTSELNRLEANQHMLIGLEKQYEGYNKSVKSLMQDIKNSKIVNALNKAHVLGEIINVNKEFEIAIEIALGSAISDIVTDNEDIAKQLINYLKINNLGRATFLPLTTVRGREIKEINNLRRMDGYIGTASELISFDVKYKNAVDYILGRNIISRDMDSGLKIAKACNYSIKIVTLQGEVINTGGSLTGGSIIHKNTNIISRKREIDELSRKISELQLGIAAVNDAISNTKVTINKLNNTVFTVKDNIYNENIELTKTQEKIANINSENEKIRNSIESIKSEILNIKENKNVIDIEINNKESLLKKINEEAQINDSKIHEIEAKINTKHENQNSVREELTRFKVQKAKIDEYIQNRLKEISRLNDEIAEQKNLVDSIKNEMHESEKNTGIYNSNIKSSEDSIELIKKSLVTFEENFKNYEVESIKVRDGLKILKDRSEGIKLELNKKENEKHKYEISMTKYETEKENLYFKLNDEIGLTYAEAVKYKLEDVNTEELKKEVQILKAQVAELGTVNVGAIEEYKDISEKYKFMNTQKEDLIHAKDELLSVINNMTEKMRTVFKENFKILRSLFTETFRELFKGGNADLILSGEDELSCNIDINVQPPGKKLQNINLLSGGEKVLSAISLLFAILKMKPTPFCILDEIEAALDDANVSRYAEFLRKFSTNTQFIVITHRKGTMECSDILYGVTMEEKGVSKIVSVDLDRQLQSQN